MTESNKESGRKPAPQQETAATVRRTTSKATEPVARGAKKAVGATDDAVSTLASDAERAAEVTSGAARTAAQGIESGRQALIAASGQVAATAKTAWTVVAHRKLVAAGVGAGLTALSAASYAMGRRAERHTHGPLTRLTGGRM
ncbi:hypothetical protein [Streptomyces sp. NPDC046759]|uniref:hypothetical protein n=1 Tax=Streptomyces sp. NPDC046759 TaxID=3155019 RepID=UPI0033DA9C5A